MINGVTYMDDFLADPGSVYDHLVNHADWDERMAIRKTASYGVAYNYSQISYPYRPLPATLQKICSDVKDKLGFEPNNCLINYYPDGNSKMGFHSDQTDILDQDTGVAIISLGTSRTLRFRQIQDKDVTSDFVLRPGSLLYMKQDVQHQWQHAVLKSDTDKGRIS